MPSDIDMKVEQPQIDEAVRERAKIVADALTKVIETLKKGLYTGNDCLEVAAAVSFCDNFSSQIIKDMAKGDEKTGEAKVPT